MTIVDHLRSGGVRVVLDANKDKPRIAGIVARKATKKASDRERRMIRIKLN